MKKVDELKDIKRDLFFRLMEDAGRVFIHVTPSMELEIGRRGLVGDEINNGITLVFNSRMKFDWSEYGIEATLAFGSTPEKCFIPEAAIVEIYSPELKVQFVSEPPPEVKSAQGKKPQKKQGSDKKAPLHVEKAEGNMITVDFTRGGE